MVKVNVERKDPRIPAFDVEHGFLRRSDAVITLRDGQALQVSVDSGLPSLVESILVQLFRVLIKRGDYTTAGGIRDQILSRISVDAGWRRAARVGDLLNAITQAPEVEMPNERAVFVRESLLAMAPFVYDDEPQADERLRWMADGLERVGELQEAERLRRRAVRLSLKNTAIEGGKEG